MYHGRGFEASSDLDESLRLRSNPYPYLSCFVRSKTFQLSLRGEEAGFRKEEVSLSSSPQEEKKRVRITVDRAMEERRKKSFEFCEEFCDGTGERVAERVPSINRYACDSTPASQPTLIPEYSRQERENDARHRLKREGLPLLV